MLVPDETHVVPDATPVPSGQQVIDIIADSREGDSETFAVLKARPDVALTVTTLKYGDYSVAGQLSFERKSAEDLGRSIIDGRLFRQMSALRLRAKRPVLLIEGLQPLSSPSGVPWHAVRGALVSVAVVFGVPILAADSPEESAEIMVIAARQMARTTSVTYVRPGYRPKGWRRRALFILQGLPGIGPGRAATLLDAFGSVAAVMAADTEGLARVDGIGMQVAERIRKAIGNEPPADHEQIRGMDGRRTSSRAPLDQWPPQEDSACTTSPTFRASRI
jgi:Fanconi anemia group M protein